MRSRLLMATSIVALCLSGVVNAEAPSDTELKAEMQALKSRIAELENKQGDTWLNERRAEEVKGLVREVLSDADTRASLLQGGATAGHNGKNFFLASEDGGFLMIIGGQIQLRYVYNNRDDADKSVLDGEDTELGNTIADDNEFGFEIPQARLWFQGHIASPRIGYELRLSVDRNNNSVTADRIVVSYELTDGLWLYGGETEAPFLRENIVETYHQLAVNRSLVNQIFTQGVVQGVGVNWAASDNVKVNAVIHDGARSGEAFSSSSFSVPILDEDGEETGEFLDVESGKAFNSDATDFAVTARIDVRLAGDWAQGDDFTSWGGSETSFIIGAAIGYTVGETGDDQSSTAFDEILTWTVDASFKTNGLAIYGAVVGLHPESASDGSDDPDLYGVVLQAGYLINDKWEPFVRWEWMDLDLPSSFDVDDEINILTFGVNYYMAKHAAKFQLDLVWALDPIPSSSILGVSNLDVTGLKPDGDDEDNQFAIRAQFQLLF